MSRRVELLPQSIAATASPTGVDDLPLGEFDRLGDECPHGIERTHEVVGKVGVQTLHAHARSPDASRGGHQIVADGRGHTTLGVLVVRALQFLTVDQRFESVHAAFALQTTHPRVDVGVHEPVERGHRRAIAQVRLVFNHEGTSVKMTNDDREATRERTTQQCLDDRLIVE